MAVKLNNLYNEIYSQYDVHLQTESCFEKKISWVHMVENIEFAPLLHGDELVFNSSLNEQSDEVRRNYIDQLIAVDAGGLIVALQTGHEFSNQLIDYCNRMQFPLFTASWETPYINIMRHLSEILLDNERKEMNLVAGLKNIIYHPHEANFYLDLFEQNGFPNDTPYTIIVLGYAGEETQNIADSMMLVEKSLRHAIRQSIMYEEKEMLILLITGYTSEQIKKSISIFYPRHPNIQLGIGSTESQLLDIYRSYRNAKIAYELSCKHIFSSPVYYNELGSYQILTNVTDSDILYPTFIENTLGKLIAYDTEHHTQYMVVLKDFFENDCSITQTANATFYHQNTLKYKVKNIKEILGYDITTNENRVNIILSLAMLKLHGSI